MNLETNNRELSTAQLPSPQTKYRHNPRLAKQVLGGKAVVLHYEGKRLVGLNDSGSAIWGLMDGEHTLEQITCLLAGQFGLDASALAADVLMFAEELRIRGLIVEETTPESTKPLEGTP